VKPTPKRKVARWNRAGGTSFLKEIRTPAKRLGGGRSGQRVRSPYLTTLALVTRYASSTQSIDIGDASVQHHSNSETLAVVEHIIHTFCGENFQIDFWIDGT
jgi:hypothetical protein